MCTNNVTISVRALLKIHRLSYYVQLLTRQPMCVWRNIEARSYKHCGSGKAMCYIFWVCVCRLSYRAYNVHAPYCKLRPARLCNIFFTLSHKRNDFRKNVIEHRMRVLILSTTLTETFLILRETERKKKKNPYWSSRKVPVILVRP
jgi:hypothetical protein